MAHCPPAAQDSLSDEALLPLKSYKYSAVDKSFISRYVLKHYVSGCGFRAQWLILRSQVQWNASVELLPLWLAPNMVTLLGFAFVVVNVALVVIVMPDLVGPVCSRLSWDRRWLLISARDQLGYTIVLHLECGCTYILTRKQPVS